MSGSIDVHVGAEALDAAKLLAAVPDERHGAQVLFAGAVRAVNQGKKVVTVAYDAFEPLAEKTLRTICEEAQGRFGSGLSFVVHHRTGELKVGEVSVVIVVTSPHRAEAYEASRYVIEELKIRVPIWKQERYDDGQTEWLRGHALCGHGGAGASGGAVDPHGHRQGDAATRGSNAAGRGPSHG